MKSSKLARLVVGLCVLALGAYLIAASSVGGYHLLKKVELGASPGGGEYFDYITVDPAARRVYMSHGTEFKVLNADSLAVAGTISGDFKHNHGMAVVPELSKGFVSDGELEQAIVVDLKTLKTTGTVKAD